MPIRQPQTMTYWNNSDPFDAWWYSQEITLKNSYANCEDPAFVMTPWWRNVAGLDRGASPWAGRTSPSKPLGVIPTRKVPCRKSDLYVLSSPLHDKQSEPWLRVTVSIWTHSNQPIEQRKNGIKIENENQTVELVFCYTWAQIEFTII